MLRPSRIKSLHCWRRRSDTNVFHRQPAVADAVTVNVRRRKCFPSEASKGLKLPRLSPVSAELTPIIVGTNRLELDYRRRIIPAAGKRAVGGAKYTLRQLQYRHRRVLR